MRNNISWLWIWLACRCGNAGPSRRGLDLLAIEPLSPPPQRVSETAVALLFPLGRPSYLLLMTTAGILAILTSRRRSTLSVLFTLGRPGELDNVGRQGEVARRDLAGLVGQSPGVVGGVKAKELPCSGADGVGWVKVVDVDVNARCHCRWGGSVFTCHRRGLRWWTGHEGGARC